MDKVHIGPRTFVQTGEYYDAWDRVIGDTEYTFMRHKLDGKSSAVEAYNEIGTVHYIRTSK